MLHLASLVFLAGTDVLSCLGGPSKHLHLVLQQLLQPGQVAVKLLGELAYRHKGGLHGG